jgi:hypothetical protein
MILRQVIVAMDVIRAIRAIVARARRIESHHLVSPGGIDARKLQ